MKKTLFVIALLLACLLIGCSKKDVDTTLEELQEDIQQESDVEEISEDTADSEDMMDLEDDVTEDSEDVTEGSEETNEEIETYVKKDAYMSFKTEMGYIGYRGSVDNADWLNCYSLSGYYDGDDFIVDKMYYHYVQDNRYDFYMQEAIFFDGNLTINDDYKLIAQTEEYSIYQDSEENYYAQIPSFNNMVISGSVEENQIQAFLKSYSYEEDNNSKDLFNNVTFGNYKFADQIKLSAYPEITFEALPVLNAFYPLEYIQLCNDIQIGILGDIKSRAWNNISGDSTRKKINKGDTFPNFEMYETDTLAVFIGKGDSPSITFFNLKAQEAYDTVKELLEEIN